MEFENEIRLRASLRKAVGEQEADTLMEKLTSIEEVRAEMHMEFAMVSARFNDVDSRFNQIDTRFNGVDGQFIGINAQLLAMQKTFVRWGATLSISLFVTAVGVIVAAFLTR
jgi:molybdopterin converting factor small subunit